MKHPTGYGGVEHHQNNAADKTHIAVDVPFLTGLFKLLERLDGAELAGSSDAELHTEDRQSEYDEEEQIEQYEGAAGALTGYVREFPYVADADGAARRQEYKAEPGLESFAFHG